jgi:hypothetical protein
MDEIKKKDDLLKNIKICDANCDQTHGNDGNCVMCGKDWYNNHKSGHTCDSTGKRGAWIIK